MTQLTGRPAQLGDQPSLEPLPGEALTGFAGLLRGTEEVRTGAPRQGTTTASGYARRELMWMYIWWMRADAPEKSASSRDTLTNSPCVTHTRVLSVHMVYCALRIHGVNAVHAWFFVF